MFKHTRRTSRQVLVEALKDRRLFMKVTDLAANYDLDATPASRETVVVWGTDPTSGYPGGGVDHITVVGAPAAAGSTYANDYDISHP
jgi:hypothetical protein